MLPSACGLGQHFQDLGHSFSLYGPPSRQITYIYYFLMHLSGPESLILESDWLIARAPAVQIFPSGPPRTDRY